jgi:hypothetical protein
MGVAAQLHAFLSSALYGDECSVWLPGRFTDEKEPLVTAGNEGGWAPGVDLDVITKRKNLPYWGSNLHSSVIQSVAQSL